jgi:hypothetical protein
MFKTILFSCACLVTLQAQAATVSYNFTQSGFTDNAGDTGMIQGSFSGNVEASGEILMPDLSAFQADFIEHINGSTYTFVFSLGNSVDFLTTPAHTH